MAKLCAYLFLFVLVFNNEYVSQLLKLPVLFVHFQDHQKRNHSISFTEFLSIHYWGQDINDNDTEEDNKLPFKKVQIHSCCSLFFAVRKVQTTTPVKWFQKDHNTPKYPALPNNFHCSLFRPPRFISFA